MTNTMAINNEALYKDELLNEEQLDQVKGGSITASLVVAGIVFLANKGYDEVSDLKELVTSDAYKAMSSSDRNKRLGKELASSFALNVALGALASPFAVAYAQYKWRTDGTSDSIRKAVENFF